MSFYCSHLSGTHHRAVGTAQEQRADRLWELPSEQATFQHTHSPSSREKGGQKTKVIYQYHHGHITWKGHCQDKPEPRLLPALFPLQWLAAPSHPTQGCDTGGLRAPQPRTRTGTSSPGHVGSTTGLPQHPTRLGGHGKESSTRRPVS